MNSIINILNKIITEKSAKYILDLFNEIKLEEEKINNIKINLVVKEIDIHTNCYTEENTIYFKKSVLDKIIFNDDINNKLNIYYIIKNIYHEIRHIIQDNEANLGLITDSSLFYICTNLIDEYYDNGFYKRNYDLEEIEIDANIYAYLKLKKIINDNKLNILFEKEINNSKEKLLIINRLDNKNNIVSIYDYLPNTLDYIIKNNPSILHKYSQLSLFYYKDGKRKSIIDIKNDIRFNEAYKNSPLFFKDMLLDDINDL